MSSSSTPLRHPRRPRRFSSLILVTAILGMSGAALARHGELPNHIPEPAPYNVDEARIHPPPHATPASQINPFANEDCTSTFDLGDGTHYTTHGSGSLLDGFCSRCHMPANYIDAVKLENVKRDAPSGLEHGLIDPDFDPTSARGTEFAFATAEATYRNTEAGKVGITCTF